MVVAFLIGHPINKKWEEKDANREKGDVDRGANIGGAGCYGASLD